MSVRLYDKGEFARVAQTIRFDQSLREVFFTLRESGFRQNLGLNPDPEPYEIYGFAERLYVANYLAYEFQYGENDPIVIPRMKEKDFAGMPYKIGDFISVLEGILYNVFTNNGNSFLGQEDMERVDRLLNTARRLYIEQLEEELGRR